jgi:DNA-binding CsgD family transcriptional regulator
VQSGSIAQALDGLYEAALTPESWPNALHSFALATGSTGCRIRPSRPETRNVRFPASTGLGAFLEDFNAEGWHQADPRSIRGVPLIESGRSVLVEHDIASDEERKRSPFYQTFLKRHGLPWWAGVAFTIDGRGWCLSILRNATQGPFTPADAHHLGGVAVRLRNALALAQRVELEQARGSVDALELVGRAALVLDAYKRCVAMNALAEEATRTDLAMTGGRLYASHPASDTRLQDLIGRAASGVNLGATTLEPIFVARREGRPYMVEAFPATKPMRDVFRSIAALIVITDLNARPRPKDSLVREALGLTGAEARLASKLAAGEELRRASDALGISYNTARSYLRSIFDKAQVSRQSELTAILARIAR